MLTNYPSYIQYIRYTRSLYTHVRFDKLGVTALKTKRTEKIIRIRSIMYYIIYCNLYVYSASIT